VQCVIDNVAYIVILFQIEIKQDGGVCPTPTVMAGQVVTYLEKEGFLEH